VGFLILPHNDYAIVKQEIDSLLQNFDYETNPDWPEKMNKITEKIIYFWDVILERQPNLKE